MRIVLYATRAVQQGQLAAKILQHHFGGVFLLPGLVGIFSRLERTFQIDLAALAQEPFGDVGQALVIDHHTVPLGLFLALARGLVVPGVTGGDGKIGYLGSRLQGPHLRILAQVADQDHLVDAACHRTNPYFQKTTLAPVAAKGHIPVREHLC
jgi:hypothetical protein